VHRSGLSKNNSTEEGQRGEADGGRMGRCLERDHDGTDKRKENATERRGGDNESRALGT